MAENDIRYRFVLKGSYTPETIPQARLAEYLAALADLYGREEIVHFVGLETSSLAILSRPEPQAEDDVAERVEVAHQDDAPAEPRRAYATLTKLITEDRAESAYIERQGATVLTFPTEREARAGNSLWPVLATRTPDWHGHLAWRQDRSCLREVAGEGEDDHLQGEAQRRKRSARVHLGFAGSG